MKEPNWDCCDEADQIEFEAYVLDRLDALDEPTQRDIEFTRDIEPLSHGDPRRDYVIISRQPPPPAPSRPGRQEGDKRDYSSTEWLWCFDVLQTLKRIEWIFQNDLEGTYRSERLPPTKWDILQARYGCALDMRRFKSFYKNRRILARSRNWN
jgi:hypothetical protein